MLVFRCSQLFTIYRTARIATRFPCILLHRQAPVCFRTIHSQNVAKFLSEDAENLNLTEDRKLYQNTHSSRLWRLHFYSLVFCVTLTYFTVFVFFSLKPSKEVLNANSSIVSKAHKFLCKWKWIICGLCGTVGVSVFIGMSMFIKRNVHSIVLLKNGKEVIIKTYGHTPILRQLVTHRKQLNEISCLTGRNEKVPALRLAMAGSKNYLYIDNSGRFYSPDLFDVTVGVTRKLKQ